MICSVDHNLLWADPLVCEWTGWYCIWGPWGQPSNLNRHWERTGDYIPQQYPCSNWPSESWERFPVSLSCHWLSMYLARPWVQLNQYQKYADEGTECNQADSVAETRWAGPSSHERCTFFCFTTTWTGWTVSANSTSVLLKINHRCRTQNTEANINMEPMVSKREETNRQTLSNAEDDQKHFFWERFP